MFPNYQLQYIQTQLLMRGLRFITILILFLYCIISILKFPLNHDPVRTYGTGAAESRFWGSILKELALSLFLCVWEERLGAYFSGF